MKKLSGIIFAACLVLIFAGCASTSGIPKEIENARKRAPEDVLVGIGSAKLGTVAQSRNLAATRARAELSNAMSSIVSNMVRDYTASSEVDPQAAIAFQENITVTLSRSDVSGAQIMGEEEDKDGQWWCVMYLSKAALVREINQAQAAARLAVPAMASFNAEDRMNEAFDRLKAQQDQGTWF